jgi:hypothetical protein
MGQIKREMDPTATNPGDRKEKIAQATYRFTALETISLSKTTSFIVPYLHQQQIQLKGRAYGCVPNPYKLAW